MTAPFRPLAGVRVIEFSQMVMGPTCGLILADDGDEQRLEALELPFAPIAKPGDLFADRHLNASGGLFDIRLPDGRAAKTPALPIAVDGQRLANRIDPPLIGEHSREVLAEAGYDDKEIAALVSEGTVATSRARS